MVFCFRASSQYAVHMNENIEIERVEKICSFFFQEEISKIQISNKISFLFLRNIYNLYLMIFFSSSSKQFKKKVTDDVKLYSNNNLFVQLMK